MSKYCYVYVLRSQKDGQFYVGLTGDLPARVRLHNNRMVASTKNRTPLELVYWEGCMDKSDAAQREKYLKSAWGKRYIKSRLRRYLTGEGSPRLILMQKQKRRSNATAALRVFCQRCGLSRPTVTMICISPSNHMAWSSDSKPVCR